MPARRIYRNTRQKVIAGVCSGIADYFDVDVAWVRLAFVLAVFASGFGLLAYVVAWIVFPRDDKAKADLEPARSETSQPATEPASPGRIKRAAGGSRNAVGIVLILLGVLFFFDQNFWWFRFDAFWPVILIGLGVYLVMRGQSVTAPDVPVTHAAASASPDPDSTHTS